MICFQGWSEECSTTEISMEGAIQRLGIQMGCLVECIVHSMAGSLEAFMAVSVAFLENSVVGIALGDRRSRTSFTKKSVLGLTRSLARSLRKAKPDSHVVETNLASRSGNAQSLIALRTPEHNPNRTITTMSFSLHCLDLLLRRIRARG